MDKNIENHATIDYKFLSYSNPRRAGAFIQPFKLIKESK